MTDTEEHESIMASCDWPDCDWCSESTDVIRATAALLVHRHEEHGLPL